MNYQNHQTVGGHEFWDRLYEGFIRCWMTSHAVEIGFDPAFAWIDDRMPMKDPVGPLRILIRTVEIHLAIGHGRTTFQG